MMPLQFPEVQQYFKRLRYHLIATEKEDSSKAVLLSTCGERAFDLIETLFSPIDIDDDDVTFDSIKTRVLSHLTPKRILHYERHQFHSMTQGSDTITTFVQRLQDRASRCELGELRDDLVLTQFIFGLDDKELREKLLSKPELTIDSAIQDCLMAESVHKAANPSVPSVSTVRKSSYKFNMKEKQAPSKEGSSPRQLQRCHSCGKDNHLRKVCKFRDAKCHSCGKIGHISAVCRSRKPKFNSNNISEISVEQNDSSSNVVMSASVTDAASLIYVDLNVGNGCEKFLLDSGSQVTIIPCVRAESLGLQISNSFSPQVKAFGGFDIPILGTIDSLTISNASCSHSGRVLIAAEGSTSILGMDFLRPLGYISLSSNPISFSDTEIEASFRLKDDVSMDGLCYAARSLPFAMKGLVEQELQRLLNLGIIYSVENPTMAAPIVPVVKQKGATNPIRICGDYSLTLNKIIDPDQYCVPRLEEILEKVSSCKVFSVLDLSDAYLQIPLSPESQLYTCVATHVGYFAYKSLQFGISAAPLIFQEVIDKVLKGIPNVAAYQDDIIIGGCDKNEHDRILQQVKQRLKTFNFIINEAKSQIRKERVRFLGFIIDGGKLLPDPDRIKAFQSLTSPKDKSQLRSALGTLRHYGLFCKNFSAIARPLYLLLKKNTPWRWLDVHKNAFRTLLQTIPSGCICGYDISKPLFVFADASKDGLGFVLSHDMEQREIVWLGSRVLTPAEANYANIEREALALVEAVKYFHKFLAGRKFVICSDHRPLQFIFDQKAVRSERVSARLQRWAITLRAYDYDIRYIKGEFMFTADTLSRLPSNGDVLCPEVNMLEINSLSDFPSGATLLNDIATSDDSSLRTLKRYVVNGWPNHIPSALLPFSKGREEYTIQDGIIYRGLRILVPFRLRPYVLRLLHQDHPGVVKMIRLARQYFWWPGLDSDINAFIRSCRTCQINARKRTNFRLSSWEETTFYLERVHIDVAHWKDFRVLVFVDAYSKWLDVQILHDMTSRSSIQALRRTIKYVGIPVSLVSDNGLNFASDEFSKFCTDNMIKHVFTPPGHHASNGQVERVIQDLKIYLNKCAIVSKEEFERQLINFCLFRNSTPAVNGSVPCDFVFQKSLRTRLSAICTERSKPAIPHPVYIRVEGRKPADGMVLAQHGRNTHFDERNRLVHDSDITTRTFEEPRSEEPEASIEEPVEEAVPAEPMLPRRSTRARRKPDRFGS